MKFLPLVLISAILVIAGCEQPDGAVGSSIGTDQNGTTRVISALIDVDTTYLAKTFSTGGSPYLYVGSAAELSSAALISFNAPALPFQWEVDSARLNLSYQGNIGEGRGINIVNNLMNVVWDESEPPSWDSLNFDIPDGVSLDDFTVDDDSNSVSLTIPGSEVYSWLTMIDSSRNDTGYTLPVSVDTSLSIRMTIETAMNDIFDSSDQLVRFRSRGATGDSLRPELMVFMSVSDSVGGLTYLDTLRLYPSKDVYVLKNNSTESSENLVIGSGANFQSNLRFDMSQLWQDQENVHIVVNRATIALHKVPGDDQVIPKLPAVWAYKISDDLGFTMPDSASYSAFSFFPTAIDSASDSLQIIVTNPASDWAMGVESNFGISLRASTQGLDINRLEFYSSNASDPALRPRLSIYYTELPR